MTSANKEMNNISVLTAPTHSHVGVGLESGAGTPHKSGAIRLGMRTPCRLCERARTRSKKRLEEVKLLEADLAESRLLVADIQRRLEVADSQSVALKRALKKYMEWWLNEYLFVRLLLQMLPAPDNVRVIAESSHSRFKTYCGEN